VSEPAASERVVLVTVALGWMLVLLNSTMVAVALPRLVDAFDTSLGSVSWPVTSYLIAMASLAPALTEPAGSACLSRRRRWQCCSRWRFRADRRARRLR
jgi:MFS family permease